MKKRRSPGTRAFLVSFFVGLISSNLCALTFVLEIESGNFADMTGTAVSGGTLFGIVVDTEGSGFRPFEWMMDRPEPGTFLKRPDGSDSSDALVYVGLTEAAGPAPDSVPGWIGITGEIAHASGEGLASTGDPWGIVWFPGAGSVEEVEPFISFGFFSRESLTIPAADSAENYRVFVGDEIKTADYIIIPEPATHAIVLAGTVFGVMLLRRICRRKPRG